MTKKYDAIVIGAGHNGITNGAYLAKAGLKVLLVEKNDYIGGATVSLPKHKDWLYSNCSYVCSLLRPEVYRDMNLAKYGLQVVPYGGSCTIAQNGDYIGSYVDPDLSRREIARHSERDADATVGQAARRLASAVAGGGVIVSSRSRIEGRSEATAGRS